MSGSPPYSSRKRQKLGAKLVEDRISNLPDSIIGNILSFLPTNDAVATGILSKRWNLLWTLAANLDFSCPEDYTGSVEEFVEFVNHVLLFHQRGCFQGLSLTWETECIPNYVNTWIGVALDRNVSKLFISADISELPIRVQSSLFRSETLRSLELNCNICINTSDFVFNLPRLERLKLISVYFHNMGDIGEIVEGCPVLKYLVIHMDPGKMVEHGYFIVEEFDVYRCTMTPGHGAIRCVLSSTCLTHLEISTNAFNSSPRPLNVSWSIELDVPSLHYLKLDGLLLSIKIQQESLAFLEEANIEINCRIINVEIDGAVFDEQVYCNNVVKDFRALGCAKTLTLHDQVIRAFSFANVQAKTKFNRLTRLEVCIDCSYWLSLLEFLMLSDNLEALIVHKYRGLETDDVPHEKDSNSNEKNVVLVPRCLSKSLQTVSVGGYYGHRDELAMIVYIIKHAKVLKMMEIGFGESVTNDINRKLQLVQEICAFPRESKNCQIKFQ